MSRSRTTIEKRSMTYPRGTSKRPPSHPGLVVKHELQELGMSVTEAAQRLHISRRTLSELVNERRGMSPEMALKLGRFFGTGTELWMNLQTRYDLWGVENDPEALREAAEVEPALT